MKIIFDEGVPRPLARTLIGHDVRTVVDQGWGAVKNGRLLDLKGYLPAIVKAVEQAEPGEVRLYIAAHSSRTSSGGFLMRDEVRYEGCV